MIDIPKLTEEELIKLSHTWYSHARNERQRRDGSGNQRGWLTNYKMSQGFLPDQDNELAGTYPTRARVFTAEAHAVIWTKVAQLDSTIDAQHDVIDFLPIGRTDIDQARKITKFENYRLVQVARVKEAIPVVAYEVVVYGTGFFKSLWNNKKNGLDLFPVSIFNIYVDPYATTELDAQYIIHREMISLSKLKELEQQGHFENVDNIENIVEDPKNWRNEKFKAVNLSVAADDMSDKLDKESKLVEVREYWTPKFTWAIAGGKSIIRKAQNHAYPRIPIFRVVANPNPHEFYGRGDIEVIKQHLLDLTLWKNILSDNAMLTVQPAFFVDTRADVDPDDIILSPAHLIEVDGSLFERRDPIWPVPRAPMPSEAFAIPEILKQDIEKMTAVSDLQEGLLEPNRTPTATEINAASAAGAIRTGLQLREFKRSFIEPFARFSFELDKRLLPRSYWFQVLEDQRSAFELSQMSPLDFNEVDIDFKATGAPMLGNRTKFAQSMLNFVGIANQLGVKMDNRLALRDIGQAMEIPQLDEILPEGPAIGQDPQQENMAMLQDIAVPVSQEDDHESHFQIHQNFVAEAWPEGNVPINAQITFGQHLLEHQQLIVQSGGGANVERPREVNPNVV